MSHPVKWDRGLPITGGGRWPLPDRPIRRLHVHTCLELGYCFEGSGVFVVADKILPFRAGDLNVIAPNVPHLACSAPGTRSAWTWIYLDPLALAGAWAGEQAAVLDPAPLAQRGFRSLIASEEHPDLARTVLRMQQELDTFGSGAELALRALALETMILLRRQVDALPEPQDSDVGTPPRGALDQITPALQYLVHGYRDRIDVPALADRCGLSEPHFRRLFRAVIGRSPRDYCLDLRMQMAGSLLRTTDRSVLTISQDVGFDTLSSFNRKFRAVFGTNPRRWRQSDLTPAAPDDVARVNHGPAG